MLPTSACAPPPDVPGTCALHRWLYFHGCSCDDVPHNSLCSHKYFCDMCSPQMALCPMSAVLHWWLTPQSLLLTAPSPSLLFWKPAWPLGEQRRGFGDPVLRALATIRSSPGPTRLVSGGKLTGKEAGLRTFWLYWPLFGGQY